MTISIQLTADQERRLRKLAETTGQTVDSQLQELLANCLDDLEDLQMAEATMQRVRSGKEPVHTSEQVRKNLGLDN